MIANPIDAIGNSRTRSELARTMAELFAKVYPDSTKEGWEMWAVKYNTLIIAKKCAVSMYRKLVI
jgi:hypothetical protein